ncbi:MAG: kaiC 2 [Myxococcaceae bacterium]|nr:kaiC 2 [Myxococcaceae bacterium]
MTAEVGRVATGIPGLDTILEGGLLQGGVYIIEGSPGVGKTTLGSHFCFNHAASGGRAVYITLLAESHTRLLQHLRRMSFFDPSMVPDRVSYISAFKVLETEGLPSLIKLVRQTMAAQKASVVVLDGLVSAEEASPSAKDFKKFIHELQVVASMIGCTALLLNSTERPRGFRPERTMVDGIIELEDDIVGMHAVRHLSIRKMRGASPVRGKHYMQISDDGVSVLPRIETVGVHAGIDAFRTPGEGRAAFGITQFDDMIAGGVPEGSVTAMVGPSGSGKTLLGLHFLHAGVQKNEAGAYFGFFERPAMLMDKAKRLGLDLGSAREGGLIEVHWNRPVEGVIDLLSDRLIAIAKKHKIKRLFIDGLQGFQAAAESSTRLREVLACLVDELENLGVTSVYSSETPDLFGENLEISMLGMSALTHNIVLLNHRERSGHTRRTLTVLKVRDSEHDLSVREFAITNGGIVVGAASAADKEPSRAVVAADKKAKAKSQAAVVHAGKAANPPVRSMPARALKKGKARKHRA